MFAKLSCAAGNGVRIKILFAPSSKAVIKERNDFPPRVDK